MANGLVFAVLLLKVIFLKSSATAEDFSLRHLGCFKETRNKTAIPNLLATLPKDNDPVQNCANLTSKTGYRVFGLRPFNGTIGCFSSKEAYTNYRGDGPYNGCLDGTGQSGANDVYFITVFNLYLKIVDNSFDINLLQPSHAMFLERANETSEKVQNITKTLDGSWKITKIDFRPVKNGLAIYTSTCVLMVNYNGTNDLENITLTFQKSFAEAYKVEVTVLDMRCQYTSVSMYLSDQYTTPQGMLCSKKYTIGVNIKPLTCNTSDVQIVNVAKAFFVDPISLQIKVPAITLDHDSSANPVINPGKLNYGIYLIRYRTYIKYSGPIQEFRYGYIKIIEDEPTLMVTTSPSTLTSIDPLEHKTISLHANLTFRYGCPPEAGFDWRFVKYYWYCRRSTEKPLFFVRDLNALPYVTPSLNSSVDNGGCFGTGPGLLNTSNFELVLNTRQLLPKEILPVEVITIRNNNRFYKMVTMEVIPKNDSWSSGPKESHGNGDIEYFNAAVRLTEVNFTRSLEEKCSPEFLELSKVFISAIYAIYSQHQKYNVSNIQVVKFASNRSGLQVNFTGQWSGDYSLEARNLLGMSVRNGSLPGNLSVDPDYLISSQQHYASNDTSCPEHPKPREEVTSIYCSFKLTSVTFSLSLLSKRSRDFKKLSDEVINSMRMLYDKHGIKIDWQVTGFAKGSVIAKLSADVTKLLSNDIQSIFKSTVQNGSVGSFTVDPNSAQISSNTNVTVPSCPMPTVSIPTLRRFINTSTRMQRSQSSTIKGRVSEVDCDDSNVVYSFKWTSTKLDNQGKANGTEKTLNNQTAQLYLGGNSLDYGLHMISFYVTRKSVTTETVWSYGIINVDPSPLVASIAGGSAVTKGFTHSFILDASSSHDPDVSGVHKNDGISFTWLCRKVGEVWPNKDLNALPVISLIRGNGTGCFGTGIGKLPPQSTPQKITIEGGRLGVQKSYEFVVLLIKGDRKIQASQIVNIVNGDPPNTQIRCNANCRSTVNPSSKLSLEVTCQRGCNTNTFYIWSLHVKSGLDAQNRTIWMEVDNLQKLLRTRLSSPAGFVVRPNKLQGRMTYRVNVEVSTTGRANTSNEYIFVTNSPPFGGMCFASPQIGESLVTDFKLNCSGWVDRETPLRYQFRFRKSDGAYAVLYHGSESSATVKLPAGLASQDYNMDIEVLISDSFGASNSSSIRAKVLPIKVKENSTLDSTLQSLTVGRSSDMAKLLRTGDIDSATQIANGALDLIVSPEQTGDNTEALSRDLKQKIVESIIDQMKDIKVQTIQTLTQVTSVVSSATKNDSLLTQDSQSSSLKIFTDLTDVLITQSKTDDEKSDDLDKGGENLLYGIGNIWNAAAKDASILSEKEEKSSEIQTNNKTQSISIAKDSEALVKRVSHSMLSRLTAGEETLIVKTSFLSLVLRRNKTTDVGNSQISEGNSTFTLPSAGSMFGDRISSLSTVDAQMVRTSNNPYTWDVTSTRVSSSVISLSLMDKAGSDINIKNLPSPIVMTIPRDIDSDKTPPKEQTFLKPSSGDKMQYRRLSVDIPGSALHMNIGLDSKGVSVSVFVKLGERPTNFSYDFKGQVPDLSARDPYVINIPGSVFSSKGVYLVGLVYQESVVTQRRVRRSCEGHGRQKRSCVEIRDPPTTHPPQNITIKPVYDPNRDLNVSISTSMSSCLYWSKSLQKWTSEGCQAANESTSSSLKCLCTHLTSFGGDFLVAPNPIDFDVVFLAFSQLDKTKNFGVIGFVVAILLLYFIVVLLCRRADKQDQGKVGPKFEIHHHKPGNSASYEVAVHTGLWYQSGTTSNVAMIITGTENQSDVISIYQHDYQERRLFGRGNIDKFIIHTPLSLGQLLYVRIWHDYSGDNPSWFLNGLQITDLNSMCKWEFPYDRWLDVLRDDGALERTLQSQTHTFEGKKSIKDKTTRSFVEEHLWVSVFARSPMNYFTRVQRATCCLSLLFSAMIVNAMFYTIGGKTEKTFNIGPLQFSLRQIIIGIESSLIVAPINLIIVQLFKIASKQRQKEELELDPFDDNLLLKRKRSSHDQLLAKPKKPSRLSHFIKATAHILSFLCVVASATFTIFYSMQWGTDISNQWLTSMIVSLVQDLFVIQPAKIIIIAVIVTLFAENLVEAKKTKRLTMNSNTSVHDCTKLYKTDQVSISDDGGIKPLSEEKKKEHKDVMKKEKRLISTAKEIALYLVFLILMCLVCYGSRTKYGFLMNSALKENFAEFDQVTDDNSFYEWLGSTLVPGLFGTFWYNGQEVANKAYINDKRSILLGMPRMRQIRVQEGHCTIPKIFQSTISRCVTSYSMDREYTTKLNYPEWKRIAPASYVNQTLTPETCPKPWKYHTSDEITSLPYWGLQSLYGGGGYVAHLGYQSNTASRVVNELTTSKWLDPRSSAVLIVFSVFNVNTEYASFLSFLYEKMSTGAGLASYKIHSIPLYSNTVSFLVFQLLFLVFALFYFVLVCVRLVKLKCTFCKDVWNCIDIILVVLSVGTVVLQVIRGIYTSDVIRQIQANPYSDLSFDYVVMVIDIEDSILALLVFVSTLKLLKLIKLDLRIVLISSTIGVSFKDLAPFSVIFTLLLFAYALLGILLFGSAEVAFSNIYNALCTILQIFVGGMPNLWVLIEQNRVLAPLYMISFFMSMVFILVNIFVAILYESQVNQQKRLELLKEELDFLEVLQKKIRSFFSIKNSKITDVSNRNLAYGWYPSNERNDDDYTIRKENNNKHILSNSKKKSIQFDKNTLSLNKGVDWCEDSTLQVHKRLKKMTILLTLIEIESKDEDVQIARMLLHLESNRRFPTPNTTSRTTFDHSKSVGRPSSTRKRKVSAITLSNLVFSEESEDGLKLVSPRRFSQVSKNGRVKQVSNTRRKSSSVNKFVNSLQGIQENICP